MGLYVTLNPFYVHMAENKRKGKLTMLYSFPGLPQLNNIDDQLLFRCFHYVIKLFICIHFVYLDECV